MTVAPATGPTLGQVLIVLTVVAFLMATAYDRGVTDARHGMPLACLDTTATH